MGTNDEPVGTNITWQIKHQYHWAKVVSVAEQKRMSVLYEVSLFLAFDRDSSTQLKRSYLLYLGFSRVAWQPSTLEQLSFSSIDSLRGSQVTRCAAAEPLFDDGSGSREKLTENQHWLVDNY